MRAELQRMFYIMPDGTIKQINPFTRTEVWTVPGRGNKPLTNEIPKIAQRIERHEPEDYCNFCESNYLNTPPEKSRLVVEDGGYRLIDRPEFGEIMARPALLRRVPNLFEIMTIEYWQMNHGYTLSPRNRQWKEAYFKEYAERFTPRLKCPVMLVGGIRSLDVAEQLYREGTAHFVSMCRPFISEPDLVNRWTSGDREPARCISCTGCVIAGLTEGGIRCTAFEE